MTGGVRNRLVLVRGFLVLVGGRLVIVCECLVSLGQLLIGCARNLVGCRQQASVGPEVIYGFALITVTSVSGRGTGAS